MKKIREKSKEFAEHERIAEEKALIAMCVLNRTPQANQIGKSERRKIA